MSKDTDEPAFPVLDSTGSGLCMRYPGMTLRDYFAAKAMQTLLAARCFPMDEGIPQYAYEVADAMIAERAK